MAGHKFNPDKAKHLNNPIRRFIMPPEKVFKEIQPAKTDTWADIGCGTGYFTIPLAGQVERVYALDISSEMLTALRVGLAKRQINNVELRQSQESVISLENSSVNGVLLAFVAHELDEPGKFLREVARILKPGGRVVIAEYAKVCSFGPPLSHRLAPEQVDRWAFDAGLQKGRSWRWSRAFVGWEYLN